MTKHHPPPPKKKKKKKKKIMARAISKNQVSDPGPSWPSCLINFVKVQ